MCLSFWQRKVSALLTECDVSFLIQQSIRHFGSHTGYLLGVGKTLYVESRPPRGVWGEVPPRNYRYSEVASGN